MDKHKMNSILFICTANMVRSPMAEALLRKIFQVDDSESQWRIESAGTWAVEDRKVTPQARQVMVKLFGIDLSKHRSRQVNRALLSSFDLILVMETGHKEAIRAEFPELAPRVYLLYEMIGQSRNVEDPIGGSLVDYEETAIEIDRLLNQGIEKIVRVARGDQQET